MLELRHKLLPQCEQYVHPDITGPTFTAVFGKRFVPVGMMECKPHVLSNEMG